jgi:hypothetical protein
LCEEREARSLDTEGDSDEEDLDISSGFWTKVSIRELCSISWELCLSGLGTMCGRTCVPSETIIPALLIPALSIPALLAALLAGVIVGFEHDIPALLIPALSAGIEESPEKGRSGVPARLAGFSLEPSDFPAPSAAGIGSLADLAL